MKTNKNKTLQHHKLLHGLPSSQNPMKRSYYTTRIPEYNYKIKSLKPDILGISSSARRESSDMPEIVPKYYFNNFATSVSDPVIFGRSRIQQTGSSFIILNYFVLKKLKIIL